MSKERKNYNVQVLPMLRATAMTLLWIDDHDELRPYILQVRVENHPGGSLNVRLLWLPEADGAQLMQFAADIARLGWQLDVQHPDGQGVSMLLTQWDAMAMKP